MNEIVRSEKVRQALVKRAVLLCENFGFDRLTRLEVAGQMLGVDELRSFNDLSEQQLRKVCFGLEAAAFVIVGLQQLAHRRRPRGGCR